MKTAFDFIKFALSHAKKSSIPNEARFPVPVEFIGSAGEWEYLYGTTGNKISQALLTERFEHYYSKHGWTVEDYTDRTKGWIGRIACDCQGLLDNFLGTDITANYNYVSWCTEKGAIKSTDKFDIGEALFIANSDGKMGHVGFVCGYLPSGEELVVEERGIRYGCVITARSGRGWTHHGKPTKWLDYSSPIPLWEDIPTEPTDFNVSSPAKRGEAYLAMQKALNAAGYKDYDGKVLVEDGAWGKRSFYAFTQMTNKYAPSVNLSLLLNGKEVYSTEARYESND